MPFIVKVVANVKSDWPLIVFAILLFAGISAAVCWGSSKHDEENARQARYAAEMRSTMRANGLVVAEEIGSHRTIIKVDGSCLVTLDHYPLLGADPEFVTMVDTPLPIQWAVDGNLLGRLQKLCDLQVELGDFGITDEGTG